MRQTPMISGRRDEGTVEWLTQDMRRLRRVGGSCVGTRASLLKAPLTATAAGATECSQSPTEDAKSGAPAIGRISSYARGDRALASDAYRRILVPGALVKAGDNALSAAARRRRHRRRAGPASPHRPERAGAQRRTGRRAVDDPNEPDDLEVVCRGPSRPRSGEAADRGPRNGWQWSERLVSRFAHRSCV